MTLSFSMMKARGRGVPKGYSGTFKGPTSYPTGGFEVEVGLKRVEDANAIGGGGYLAEVVSITDNKVKILVRYFDYPAAAAGTAIEIPSGTDLSGVTFRVIAVGE